MEFTVGYKDDGSVNAEDILLFMKGCQLAISMSLLTFYFRRDIVGRQLEYVCQV